MYSTAIYIVFSRVNLLYLMSLGEWQMHVFWCCIRLFYSLSPSVEFLSANFCVSGNGSRTNVYFAL